LSFVMYLFVIITIMNDVRERVVFCYLYNNNNNNNNNNNLSQYIIGSKNILLFVLLKR